MDQFEACVEKSLMENIAALAPPQDAVSELWWYERGAGRGLPTSRDLVLFTRQDGSYIPVSAAVRGDNAGLINRDVPALGEAGYTITLRFEVGGPTILGNTILIGCTVAGVSITRGPGDLTDVVPLGGG